MDINVDLFDIFPNFSFKFPDDPSQGFKEPIIYALPLRTVSILTTIKPFKCREKSDRFPLVFCRTRW
jgi:hypothetical protein